MAWSEKTDAEKMRAIMAVLSSSALCGKPEEVYNQWLTIGMACKNTGLSCSDWDVWSQADADRYTKGECEKKWHGFKKKGVGVGTILDEICAKYGCKDQVMAFYDGEDGGKVEALNWDDGLPATEPRQSETRKEAAVAITEPGDDWEPGRELADYLGAVFRDGETFNVVFASKEKEKEPGKWRPASRGVVYDVSKIKKKLQDGETIENVLGPYNSEAGAWIRINPAKDGTDGAENEFMASFRHVLVEADKGTLAEQFALIRALNLPCSAIVYSGNKSIHAIVRVDAADEEQYRQRVDLLYKVCEGSGLEVDRNVKNVSRLSRVPGVKRGGHKQFLIATNCGAASWEEWEEQNAGGGMIPVIDAGEWLETPEPSPEPVLKGWLDRGDHGFIVGASKMRKTFFTLQLAVSMATGRGFLGFGIEKPLKVLYLQFEVTKAHFQRRLEAMARAMMIDKEQLKGRLMIANMRGLADDCKTEQAIRRAIKASGPAVVVIDPVYKLIDGDESDQKTAKEFVAELDRLGHDTGAAIVGVFHTPKLGRDTAARRAIDAAAGSGVFGRAVDSQFVLSPHEKGPEYAILSTTCRNYQTPGDKTLHFENGMFTAEAATPAVPPSAESKRQQLEEQAEITARVVAGWFKKAGVPMNQQTLKGYLTDAGCGSRNNKLEQKTSELKQAGMILEDEKRGPRNSRLFRPSPEVEAEMLTITDTPTEGDVPF